MLKVVVFDTGYGGEFFADRLEEELPVIKVIRVINWRDAEKINSSHRNARRIVEQSLRPYLNEVDLIIFANYYLTIATLKYFSRKYKKQKFLGLNLKYPDTFLKRDLLILSVSSVSRTIVFNYFRLKLNRESKVLNVDSWPLKIDDGELTLNEISQEINGFLSSYKNYHPEEVILVSSQFNDIKPELRTVLGHNLKIYDGFNDLIIKITKTLHLRGRTGKKAK